MSVFSQIPDNNSYLRNSHSIRVPTVHMHTFVLAIVLTSLRLNLASFYIVTDVLPALSSFLIEGLLDIEADSLFQDQSLCIVSVSTGIILEITRLICNLVTVSILCVAYYIIGLKVIVPHYILLISVSFCNIILIGI